jgi:Fe-S-cluster-containing hydrogenase component 2
MTRQVLIDMIRLRSVMAENPEQSLPEGFFSQPVTSKGLKTVRELATFRFTCRKCEDAPCIAVCPAEALEKDSDGLVDRHTNLCISCKSCVTICPFGTMMTDYFKHHRNKDLFYDLNDPEEVELFIAACPPGTVSVTDSDEDPEKNIFRLNDNVLIKEYLYMSEKQ